MDKSVSVPGREQGDYSGIWSSPAGNLGYQLCIGNGYELPLHVTYIAKIRLIGTRVRSFFDKFFNNGSTYSRKFYNKVAFLFSMSYDRNDSFFQICCSDGQIENHEPILKQLFRKQKVVPLVTFALVKETHRKKLIISFGFSFFIGGPTYFHLATNYVFIVRKYLLYMFIVHTQESGTLLHAYYILLLLHTYMYINRFRIFLTKWGKSHVFLLCFSR